MAEDVNPVADVLLEFTQALIHHVIIARGAYADDGSRSTVYGVRLRAPPASRRVEVERFLEDCLSTLRAPLSSGVVRRVRVVFTRDGRCVESVAFDFLLKPVPSPPSDALKAEVRAALTSIAMKFALVTEDAGARSRDGGEGGGALKWEVLAESDDADAAREAPPSGWRADDVGKRGEIDRTCDVENGEVVKIKSVSTAAFDAAISLVVRR